ncbi:hypothetical protein F0562_034798 [Nyssa sinensis]|uniref:BHLH domain-containing protein n=1 Tax=Nyssa sinensis TaxID=561372 RepID=A0A5J5ADB9_9ASTE|nr:hypothetical protein F0562_034798 [Nyssa sinensis]
MRGKGKEKGKEIKQEEEEEKDISKLILSIMEGYSDSIIPPLSEFSPIRKTTIDEKSSSSSKLTANGTEYIMKERDRREKMTQMFSVLQSMVPNLFPKDSRETIVSNTIEYIQRLEEEKKRLEGLKKSSLPAYASASAKPSLCHCTNRNFAVDVAVSGAMAFFEIRSLVRRRCLATEIFEVFAKHQAEVLATNVAVNKQQLKVTITALMGDNGDHNAEKIKRDILLL